MRAHIGTIHPQRHAPTRSAALAESRVAAITARYPGALALRMLQADVALSRVIRQTARLRPATAAEAADQARALAALTRAQVEVWRELREGLGIRLSPRWAGAIDASAIQTAAAWLGPAVDGESDHQADQAGEPAGAGGQAG